MGRETPEVMISMGKVLMLCEQVAVQTQLEIKLKVGANAPCPCGSGNKYKRCCRKLSKAAAVKPQVKRNYGSISQKKWPLIKKSLPEYVQQKAAPRYLSRKHFIYIHQCLTALKVNTEQSAKDGLELLERIPLEHRYKISGLVSIQSQLLEILGRDEESAELIIQ